MADEADEMQKKFLEKREQIDKEGRKEYEGAYKRMIEKWSPNLLEPFAKILLENDGFEMDTISSMESLKASLLSELLKCWNTLFWEPLALDKLTDLDMIKEVFASNEGENCHIKTKTPAERLLAAQMLHAKKRLDFLNTQIEAQNKILEHKCAEANKRRLFLQKIEADGMRLQEHVEHLRSEERLAEKANENLLIALFPTWCSMDDIKSLFQ